jgi:hypothetical protein
VLAEMIGYAEEVKEEARRVQPFIQDTLKYLDKTLNRFLPEEVYTHIKY